ncbi:alpha/beta hydrolase (plasmid) [Deinococcus aetherius]|uniref:Alpha/beta hydrolase n=1 Tax=Deinococcus aetherius TaxID=200252 RepID=A0ABN6RKK9_9DEIO|nr:alpha/beta hydrolase [Deinococcus aetherius]BDP43872.1 alpha/beta hydrolase [Deinococcus aetherius]
MKRTLFWTLLGGLAAAGFLTWRGRLTSDPTTDFTDLSFSRRSPGTPSGEMSYYEAGEGQLLVLLHGIGGGASAWYWSKVAPVLARRFRVVAPDWVGWGRSEHPRRSLLGGEYVDQLRTLLAHLGEPVHVVAQGLAAGWVAELARERPELFGRLILWTPSGGLDFGEDSFAPFYRRTFTPIARSRTLGPVFYRLIFHRGSFIRSWLRGQGFYNPAAVSREVVEGSLDSARRPGAAYSALPFLSGDLRYDLAPLLRDLPVPAVMVWGEHERQVGLPTGRRLAAQNPGIELIVLDRARGTPEQESPARSAALLEQLLQSRPPVRQDGITGR